VHAAGLPGRFGSGERDPVGGDDGDHVPEDDQ
jgi:hypothetical protein